MGLLAYMKTQFVVHLLIGFVFVVSGLVINFIQLCTLVLWPVNRQLYRRLNCRLAYSLWSRKYLPSRVAGGAAWQQVRKVPFLLDGSPNKPASGSPVREGSGRGGGDAGDHVTRGQLSWIPSWDRN